MQLMPGTAKETAEKIGLSYSPAKLVSDPLYHTTLGASYLDRQLETYNGSLLLAAASYNAVPGRARAPHLRGREGRRRDAPACRFAVRKAHDPARKGRPCAHARSGLREDDTARRQITTRCAGARAW